MITGATHADDLFYVFNTVFTKPPAIASVELQLIKTMVELVTSFAISGTPTILQDPIWKEVVKTDNPPMVLNIANSGVSMTPMVEYENIRVFNEVYESARVDLI